MSSNNEKVSDLNIFPTVTMIMRTMMTTTTTVTMATTTMMMTGIVENISRICCKFIENLLGYRLFDFSTSLNFNCLARQKMYQPLLLAYLSDLREGLK